MFYNQDNSSAPIKFTPAKDSSYQSINEVGTRPTGDPKSKKDFKKIFQKDSQYTRDGEEIDSEMDDQLEVATPVKKAPSLFDLTSGKTAPEQNLQANPMNASLAPQGDNTVAQRTVATKQPAHSIHTPPTDSPSVLFAKLSNVDGKKITSSSLLEDDNVAIHPGKERFTTRFSTEEPDLSYINPLMAMTSTPIDDVQLKTERTMPLIPASSIQELVNQLVERVYEIKMKGETETTLTLKHPPILAGTNLVVTSYESARGEFNLSFENLTQAAKDLLDMRANQESLLLALEKKGYAVHIITTTTIIENRPIADSRFLASDDHQREQGSGREKSDDERT